MERRKWTRAWYSDPESHHAQHTFALECGRQWARCHGSAAQIFLFSSSMLLRSNSGENRTDMRSPRESERRRFHDGFSRANTSLESTVSIFPAAHAIKNVDSAVKKTSLLKKVVSLSKWMPGFPVLSVFANACANWWISSLFLSVIISAAIVVASSQLFHFRSMRWNFKWWR